MRVCVSVCLVGLSAVERADEAVDRGREQRRRRARLETNLRSAERQRWRRMGGRLNVDVDVGAGLGVCACMCVGACMCACVRVGAAADIMHASVVGCSDLGRWRGGCREGVCARWRRERGCAAAAFEVVAAMGDETAWAWLQPVPCAAHSRSRRVGNLRDVARKGA
eukprot:865385-Pleurochrysis_carterae.AAC.1